MQQSPRAADPSLPSRALALLGLIWTFAAASVRAAGPDIGLEWGPTDLRLLVVGELAADPGLECVAQNTSGLITVYRIADGQALGDFPAQLSSPLTNVTLRDTDNDGFAEMLCLLNVGGGTTRVGLLDMGGGLHRVFPDVTTSNAVTAVDFLDISAAEPRAIALAARQLLLLSSQTGVFLYRTDDDPGIGPGWLFSSMLNDDFDQDGNDEIFVTMNSQSTPGMSRTFLIGDRSTATAVDGLGNVAHVALGQSWPNPAHGPTRIRFELQSASRVRLRVFDAAGRLVRTLENGHVPAGAHQRMWDGTDDRDRPVARGIYFYELDVDGHSMARKVVQLR